MTRRARLYGIATCDQVRKARAWLDSHGLTVPFHDVRRDGLDPADLARWLSHLPWDALLNRRSTTWRALDAATQAAIVDSISAQAVLQAHPTLLKRPLLELDSHLILGFAPARYHELFFATSAREAAS